MAVKILAVIQRNSPRVRPVPMPITTMQRLGRLQSMHWQANQCGWHLAAARLRQEIVRTLQTIRESVDESLDALSAFNDPNIGAARFGASVPELMDDLKALEAEFEAVEFHTKSRTLSVTTGPIELQGVYLGPFQIVLDCDYLGESRSYRVIATDPHPAATCDSTTHPHVQSESLCEGDGRQPILHALASGRIFDFFVIVHQVLQTYNRHSAYTPLKDWFGVECRDCGGIYDDHECCSCSSCRERTCSECSNGCSGCDDAFCSDCTEMCEGCDSRLCGSCLSSCNRCNESFCKDCLTENKCDACHHDEEQQTEKETDATTPETTCSTASEIHPLRLGETEVPA
ncbi:hypothetical protein [Roseimaritima ulvae]|nr:hypothetical protein [Roseimaritima ulvae]